MQSNRVHQAHRGGLQHHIEFVNVLPSSPDCHAKFLPETPASANVIDAHDGVRG